MNVLVIEDSPGDARLIREMLREFPGASAVRVAKRLASALEALGSQPVDLVLLDLNLPDSRGLETLISIQAVARELPVVVITSVDDEALAIEAVRLGAQDYLVKGQISGGVLRRSLQYAIERKRAEAAVPLGRQASRGLLSILVVEDNPGDARLVQEMLREVRGAFSVGVSERLGEAIEALGSQAIDLVLLDLNLPDSRGLGTVTRLQAKAPKVPMVVMTSIDDEALAVEAVRLGAQDYLVKGQISGGALRRSLQYAIERKRTELALRESEHRWAVTLASIGDAVISMDAAGRVAYMNAVAEAQTGWHLREAFRKPIEEVFRVVEDGRSQDGARRVRGVLYHGTMVVSPGNTALVQKAGRVVPIEYTAASIREPDGGTSGAVVVFRDVTERRRLEDLKDQFIGMVSHEMRTPLSVVLGGLHTLLAYQDRLPKDDWAALLGAAYREAESLSEIVTNMLELTRAQAGRLGLGGEPVDVAALLSKMVGKAQSQHPTHRFVIRAKDAACPPVHADPVRIERVVYNLVDNAAKYSPEGSTVEVTTEVAEGSLVVCVSDQGDGISPEDQARLFTPFERLSGERSRATSGTGLGLVVCQKLVEAHGGRMWVQSEPGNGSTFCFALPLKPESTPAKPEQLRKREPARPEQPDAGSDAGDSKGRGRSMLHGSEAA